MGNTKHTKEQIRERIQQKKILFDGAFGTYYGGKYDTKQLPELANLEAPERVLRIPMPPSLRQIPPAERIRPARPAHHSN